MRLHKGSLFLGMVALLGICTASFGAEIKVGHVLNADHNWHTCLVGFAEDVAKATEGRVTFQIFPSSQLGNEKDLIEGLSMSLVDGGLIGGDSFAILEPKMGIEVLPYAWPDHESAYRAYDGKLGDALLKLLKDKGVVGLAWWENGFRHITNDKKPIKVPEDLEGLKIRVPLDQIRVDTFALFGASPISVNFGELYTALQQKVVDGQENPFSIIYSSAFYEVQKYLSLSSHIWGSALLCVNSNVWKSISPEDQKVVLDIAKKWRDEQRRQTVKEEEEFLAKLKEKGMKVNKVDKDAFKSDAIRIWDQYEFLFGEELMDLLRQYGNR